ESSGCIRRVPPRRSCPPPSEMLIPAHEASLGPVLRNPSGPPPVPIGRALVRDPSGEDDPRAFLSTDLNAEAGNAGSSRAGGSKTPSNSKTPSKKCVPTLASRHSDNGAIHHRVG